MVLAVVVVEEAGAFQRPRSCEAKANDCRRSRQFILISPPHAFEIASIPESTQKAQTVDHQHLRNTHEPPFLHRRVFGHSSGLARPHLCDSAAGAALSPDRRGLGQNRSPQGRADRGNKDGKFR